MAAELRQVNIRLDGTLVERLKGIAEAEGLSLNQLLQRFLSAAASEYQGAVSASDRLDRLEERMAEVERRLG